MARAVFGMHGAGGNGSIQQGFGSNGDQPMHGDFYTMGGYDGGGQIQYRTPSGAQGTIGGLPAAGGWNNPSGVAAYITAARAALESTLGITIDSLIVHGFSYGGGGAQQLAAANYTDGGRVKGFICDDPVYWGGPPGNWNHTPIRFYTCVGGPLPSTPQLAQLWGTTAVRNPLGDGAHRPMTFVFGSGPNGIGAPPDETVAGGTVSGVTIPSMWSGGGPVTPPPTVTDAWPKYHAENATILGGGPTLPNIQKYLNTATGARGTGYIGSWYQSGEGIRFNVTVPTGGGTFKPVLHYRQDQTAASTTRQLRVDGVNVGTPVAIPPNSSSWDASTWTDLDLPQITLTAGAHTVDVMYAAGGGPDVDEVNFVVVTTGGGGDGSGGTPTTAFDAKTNRAGFHMASYVGGWDAVDEGLTWSVPIATAGAYRLRFRCSNKGPNNGHRQVLIDGVVAVADLVIPVNATGDVDNAWQLAPADVNLTAGTHTVKITVGTGQGGQLVDIDELQVWLQPTGGGGTTPPPTTDPGTAPPTTGTETKVQAESGSIGSPAVDGLFFATAATNPQALGTYEGTGYAARWYQSGENLSLVLTAPVAANYTLRFHYRNGNLTSVPTRTWSVNGTPKSPAVSFPKTAPTWTDDVWGDVFAYTVPLLAGANTLVLTCPAGASQGVDLDYVGFIQETGSGGGNNGGGTTPLNVSVVVQAETGAVTAADPSSVPATATYLAGYNGSGFHANDWHPGDKLDLTVTIPAGGAGDYALRIRYVNPETFAFSKDLAVNNVSRGTLGPFPPTAGNYSGAWQNLTRDTPNRIPLTVGTNHIVLTTTGEYGNLLIDEIEVTAVVQTGGGGGSTTDKKVIYHSFDIPNAAFLAANRAYVDTLPFDGATFTMLPYQSTIMSGSTAISEAQFGTELDNLGTGVWTKVIDKWVTAYAVPPNGANVFTGTTQWANAAANFQHLAAAVAARNAAPKNIKGIFFDTETYFGSLWEGPDSDWSAAYARGQQIMAAIIAGWPAARVLVTHGVWASEPATEAVYDNAGAAYDDLSSFYNTVGSFVAGMVNATFGTSARVIDGGEIYTARTAGAYLAIYNWHKTGLANLPSAIIPSGDRANYKTHIQVGFGIYDQPWNGATMDENILKATTQLAVNQSDEVVWVYTERYDWLGVSGAPDVPTVWKTRMSEVTGHGVGSGTGSPPPPPPPPTTGGATVIGGVQLFPADNVFYTDVSALPVRGDSTARINGTMARNEKFSGYGYTNDISLDPIMPLVVVPSNQAGVPITSWKYAWSQQESDPGPYPVPTNIVRETNTDKHVIAVQPPNWLYEFWDADPSGGGWAVGQASRWDLRTNAMRPPGITSADAAGMPIAPGIIRLAEIQAGVITHALRITVDFCSAEYEWPANHVADMSEGVSGTLMKMGTWLRLKSSVNISGFPPAAKTILTALKKYGAIVIDIGPNWKITAEGPESAWNWNDISTMRQLHGTDLEVVNTASLIENSRTMSTTQS